MVQGIRNPVLRILVYGHVWLALGAAVQTAWMQELLDLAGWRAPLLAFCGTIVGYTFMRWARMDHPELAKAPHMVWFRENKKPVVCFALFCLGCGSAIALPHALAIFHILWPAAVITLFYVVPPGLVGGRTIGLRRVPLLKAFLITGCWAMVTVLLPLGMNDVEWDPEQHRWLIEVQGAFFLALALAFDVRDRARDERGLRTIPQVLHPGLTLFFAVVLLLFPALVCHNFAALGHWLRIGKGGEGWPLGWVFASVGYLCTAAVVGFSGSRRGPLYHDLLVDGVLVLVPMLWWLGTLL
jgi:hypothetical protein